MYEYDKRYERTDLLNRLVGKISKRRAMMLDMAMGDASDKEYERYMAVSIALRQVMHAVQDLAMDIAKMEDGR